MLGFSSLAMQSTPLWWIILDDAVAIAFPVFNGPKKK
jgi:hypothetical protein